MRDFKQEHARRQQSKKRIAFEIDRQDYDALTPAQRKELAMIVRKVIDRFLKF